MSNEHGVLYVVATPIGNLKDISARALGVLARVDGVLAEDTRHSARLLEAHGISTPTTSLHAHNESRRTPRLVERLLAGESFALVCDAGTPTISDPGTQLVRLALENGIEVTPLPGACALVAALSVSGIGAARFVFEGFLPATEGARRNRLERLRDERRTLVFYEAPHRIREVLDDMVRILGAARTATLVREITKSFETVLSGTLSDIAKEVALDENQSRGEFVLVVEGARETVKDRSGLDAVLRILLEELSVKQAVPIAVKLTGCNRNEAYRLATRISHETTG